MTDSQEAIEVRHDLQTLAFYNLENLFDLLDDKRTNDNDFLPTSVKKWTPKRYDNKLRKLSFAISSIGKKETGKHPAIVGLAEVESAKVIQDLIAYKHLETCNYAYVHYDSLDERGIDVALIYDTTAFEVSHSEVFRIHLTNEQGMPDYTRDILLVSGFLDGEAVHVIVNHWSSRREGEKETEPKRMASSHKVAEIISNLRLENPEAKIIVMGDFNDDPSSNSIKNLVQTANLYNPMDTLRSFSRGTTMHNRQWNLFDQIIFSTNFFESTPNKLEFDSANIFDEDFLKLFNGKFKGTPYRTYIGKKYQGGYSDHFPVYAIFKR
ncbi:endonuclease [Mariniflexile sp. AS56]|uniref:endonuclease/exonuclease/phosphatase family protein n=1 Tax=Mariniflexile sp. AS56 TaxID=3063957 RepID=UPI0026F15B80|nr:endonuclease [Mariniflexile sp. AS56]MDO7171031.1 endonuclease [Mariniflexile sp. AS56]